MMVMMVVVMVLLLVLDILESNPDTNANTKHQQNQHPAKGLDIEFVRSTDGIRFSNRCPLKLRQNGNNKSKHFLIKSLQSKN